MIRLILVVLAVVIFLITMIPALFILWIIGKFNKRAKDIISLRMVQVIFRIALFFAGTKITVIGKERIPQDEPVLYVGNHRSFFDILVTYIQCKNCTGYISKKEIEKVPLLVNWMRNLHCLFLDREDTKQALKIVLDGIALMKQGVSMCIFPEGTRGHVEGEIGEFKGGAFKMAEKTGCAIVPITISNTAAIWEDHLPWIKSAKVVVEYGEPVYPKDMSKEDRKHIAEYFRNIMLETLKKNETYFRA